MIAAFLNATHCFYCYVKPLVVSEIILGSSTLAGAVAALLLVAEDDNYYCYFLELLWSCSWKFDADAFAADPLALPLAAAAPLLCFSYL